MKIEKQIKQKIEKEKITCNSCKEEYEDLTDLVTNPENKATYLCMTCYNETYVRCENCTEEILKEDSHFVSLRYNEGEYCQTCYDDLFNECLECGHVDLTENNLRAPDGTIYCSNHFNDYCCSCYGCGDILWNDGDAYTSNDESYCESCYNEKNTDWESDSTQNEIRGELTKEYRFNKLIGIELEVEGLNEIKNGSLTIPTEITKSWNLKQDGSLTESGGIEFTTCRLSGNAIKEEVERLTTWLNEKTNATISKNCGYHLHINCKDITDTQVRQVFLVYNQIMPYLRLMVSPSRRNNEYCSQIYFEDAILDDTNVKRYSDSKFTTDRYRDLNLCSLQKYGTIEIRLHQGTINAEKILNWVKINLEIYNYATKIDIKRAINFKGSIKSLLNILRHDVKLQNYYKKRVIEFEMNNEHPLLKDFIKIGERTELKILNTKDNIRTLENRGSYKKNTVENIFENFNSMVSFPNEIIEKPKWELV